MEENPSSTFAFQSQERNYYVLSNLSENLPHVSLKRPKEFLSLCLPNSPSPGSNLTEAGACGYLAGEATERPRRDGKGWGWGGI